MNRSVGKYLHGVGIRWLGLGAAAMLLTACNGIEVHNLNLQIAATGTEIEARQVVALVYAQAPDAEIDKLLYSGGDLTQAIKRLREHYPKLKPWLDQGIIGNTASGFVSLRDGSRREQLSELLWEENRDRAFLYDRASKEVGHGGDTLAAWLPYASSAFGKEWIGQGQADWWVLNEEKAWVRR